MPYFTITASVAVSGAPFDKKEAVKAASAAKAEEKFRREQASGGVIVLSAKAEPFKDGDLPDDYC